MTTPSDAPPNPATPFALRFQKLKADIHRQLIEMLDISKLGHWKPERLRREVRSLATRLAKNTSELLNEVDRERLIDEIMAEVFGLGPLDGLMQRSERQRHSGQRAVDDLRRAATAGWNRPTWSSPTTPI